MYKPRSDLSRFAVITTVFNPVRYRTRYERYRQFAYHMAHSGVNLYTIECVFESATRFGLPPQRFEVTRPDNPQHFQVVAPSIIWMKENLINIVVQQLPPHIDRIAWIDADVEFERLDWPLLAMAALDRYPIVQLFKMVYITGAGGKHEVLKRSYSVGYSVRRGRPIMASHSHGSAHPGYAWAMHRAAFSAIGGLLDFCIVGSDDCHFAYALLGRIQETYPSNLHRDYGMLAKSWGDGVASVAGRGANVSYVDVNLYHRWYGSRNLRSHLARWLIPSEYHFSPLKDLMRDNQSGAVHLTNKRRFDLRLGARRVDEIQQAMVYYFLSRDEDSGRAVRPVPMLRYSAPPVFHQPQPGFSYPFRRQNPLAAPIRHQHPFASPYALRRQNPFPASMTQRRAPPLSYRPRFY